MLRSSRIQYEALDNIIWLSLKYFSFIFCIVTPYYSFKVNEYEAKTAIMITIYIMAYEFR